MIITMKTYVVTLSKRFPKNHKQDGNPTGFRQKYENREKIHTIRANFPFWDDRFKVIVQDNGCLSLRQWSGKPYASKQEMLADLYAKDGIGIQELFFADGDLMKPRIIIQPSLSNPEKHIIIVSPSVLAKNDGLSLDDWLEWFSHYDLSKSMAIIHFTSFRYKD